MFFKNDEAAMDYAINLANKGLAKTFPNPIVGAVITSSAGELISTGFHQGVEHAEVLAIKAAAQDLSEASIYVTLEPCNHFGKTGPCTQAIIASGIKRVYFANFDPNPIAAGGLETLKAAGIDVITMVSHEAAADANRDWLTKIALKRPRTIWKIAATLDGKVAALDGTSKWITSEEARVDVALLRSKCDAIITSTATVLADNPTLDSKGVGQNPVRIVVGNTSIPADFNIFNQAAETVLVKSRSTQELIEILNQRGFNRVMIEAGPTLGTAFMQAGIIDEILIYQAPKILGSGKSAIGDLNIATLSNAISLSAISTEQIGSDLKSHFYLTSALGHNSNFKEVNSEIIENFESAGAK